MPRIRTVKPEYAKNRKVRKVSRDARLLNIHLWNLADDDGRLQALPRSIIGDVFPGDEDVTGALLERWLNELEGADLIARYVSDGDPYISCHDFRDHQVISHPKDSLLPAPPPRNADSSNAPVTLHERSVPEVEVEVEVEQGKGTGNRESAITTADAPLSHLLADMIASNDPDGKRPTVRKPWADAERLLVERDRRDPIVAERLIRWCQADEFWRANVRSMPKFREKYGQLHATAKRKAKPANADRVAELVNRAREAA